MGGLESGPGQLATSPLLLTAEEAAEVLRVGRTTIYALRKAGDLQTVHIGRSRRISRAELEFYVCRLGPRAGAPAIERAQADDRASADSSSWTRHRRTPSESTGGSPQSDSFDSEWYDAARPS